MLPRPELGPLVTFVPNKKLPVYSWFYYKEGFSRDFVIQMFEEFNLEPNPEKAVLDPFMGVGTTLVASREYGVTSYGFDVSPLAVFASRVKTRDYDIEELRRWKDWLFKQKFYKVDAEVSGLVKRAFNRHILDDILFFREIITGIPDEKVRDFFLLALINSTNKCSYAFKDGAVLKFRKRPVPPLREMLKRTIKKMIKDLERIKFKPVAAYASVGDARQINLEDNSIDMIVTSPPYLNKIEYTKVYSIEMELFFPHIRVSNLIHSAIGLDAKVSEEEILELSKYLDPKDPLVAFQYFKDMKQALHEMFRVLKSGGVCLIVVGNGCFPHKVIESDVILGQMAEEIGLILKDIWVANQRWCMKNRTAKVGLLRESVVVLEKP